MVRNTDTSIHSANVTVTLLNSTGHPIVIGGVEMVQSKLTGDVDGGATKTLIYIFTATNLVQAYHSPFVEIRDLS
ncbi:hypothetical protein B6U84_00225 [Candidatus Bathyarchaeota archaeon ex4484_40]|nr:MAG: hypothetical protein B6U84_00225 [Candidatus Bathyarchaeota archaeon ex4484_40]